MNARRKRHCPDRHLLVSVQSTTVMVLQWLHVHSTPPLHQVSPFKKQSIKAQIQMVSSCRSPQRTSLILTTHGTPDKARKTARQSASQNAMLMFQKRTFDLLVRIWRVGLQSHTIPGQNHFSVNLPHISKSSHLQLLTPRGIVPINNTF